MSKVLVVDRALLERLLSNDGGDGRYDLTEWNAARNELRAQLAQPAEAKGVVAGSKRLMETLAALAMRKALRPLHDLCEQQKQVSTARLEQVIDSIGDNLAGDALNLRIEFDKLLAALSAVTAERDRLRKDRDDCLEARQYYADKYGEVIVERERLRAELEMLRDNNRKAAISDAAMAAKEA